MTPEEFIAKTRAAKEDQMARWSSSDSTDQNDADVNPIVIGIRAGEVIAVSFPQSNDADSILCVVVACCRGFMADEVYIANEVVFNSDRINPLTGQPWKRGEMADVFNNDRLSIVHTAIHVYHCTRGGISSSYLLEYEITNRQLHWGTGNESKADGLIPETIREAFNADNSNLQRVCKLLSLSPEEGQKVLDCHTVNWIASGGTKLLALGSLQEAMDAHPAITGNLNRKEVVFNEKA